MLLVLFQQKKWLLPKQSCHFKLLLVTAADLAVDKHSPPFLLFFWSHRQRLCQIWESPYSSTWVMTLHLQGVAVNRSAMPKKQGCVTSTKSLVARTEEPLSEGNPEQMERKKEPNRFSSTHKMQSQALPHCSVPKQQQNCCKTNLFFRISSRIGWVG